MLIKGKEVNIKIGGDFDPVPNDKYTVQISDLDVVPQFNKWKGKDQDYLNYQFTILNEKPMDEEDSDNEETTRGKLLWRRTSQILSTKSWLMKLVVAVYGRDLTDEEQEAFSEDPEAIVGKQLNVMTEQNPSKDGSTMYANIISFSKCKKPLEPWFTVEGRKEQVVNKTTPVEGLGLEDAFPEGDLDDPLPNPALDEAVEEVLEDDEDDVAELEAKLKAAKAKKTKAKAKAKPKAVGKVKAHEVIKN